MTFFTDLEESENIYERIKQPEFPKQNYKIKVGGTRFQTILQSYTNENTMVLV